MPEQTKIPKDDTDPANILIMDDKPAIIKMLTKLLEKIGYQTDYAMTGEELIQKFKKAVNDGKKYDLLILDLIIPNGMNGEEALAQILEIDPEVNAIVSSGYSQNPVMSNYEEYGFKGVLPKPYTLEDLKDTLNQFL